MDTAPVAADADRLALPKLRRRKRADNCDVSAVRAGATNGSDMLMNTLPPLPQTKYKLGVESDGYSPDRVTDMNAWDDDQMRAYGEACAAAERMACAELVLRLNPCYRGDCEILADAIRARGET